jgi:hypothetical protein
LLFAFFSLPNRVEAAAVQLLSLNLLHGCGDIPSASTQTGTVSLFETVAILSKSGVSGKTTRINDLASD